MSDPNASAYQQYLKSPKWQVIRRIIAMRDNYTCQECGCDCRKKFEVHHLHYKYLFREEEHPACLVLLCPECHRRITELDKAQKQKEKQKRNKVKERPIRPSLIVAIKNSSSPKAGMIELLRYTASLSTDSKLRELMDKECLRVLREFFKYYNSTKTPKDDTK